MKTRDWSNLGSTSVTVRRFEDYCVTYASIFDACRALRLSGIECLTDSAHYGVGWDPYYHYHHHYEKLPCGTPYMLFDDMGIRIPLNVIQHYANITKWQAPYRRRRPRYVYRRGPVEGIGKGRYRNRWRYPQTAQEIRENDFCRNYDDDCSDYSVKLRACRRSGWPYLPTTFDDIYRTGHGPDWKRHRAKQWKGSGKKRLRCDKWAAVL